PTPGTPPTTRTSNGGSRPRTRTTSTPTRKGRPGSSARSKPRPSPRRRGRSEGSERGLVSSARYLDNPAIAGGGGPDGSRSRGTGGSTDLRSSALDRRSVLPPVRSEEH